MSASHRDENGFLIVDPELIVFVHKNWGLKTSELVERAGDELEATREEVEHVIGRLINVV